MNRPAAPSINAVLANDLYHTAPTSAVEASRSPISPSTPSFHWPRRVKSPEPYVPLRKASPERLSSRTQKPTFITTNAGVQALGPATASSIALPQGSSITAVQKDAWRDMDAEDEQGAVRQGTRKPSSPVESKLSLRRQVSSGDAMLNTLRQGPVSAGEPPVGLIRQGTWPLPETDEVNDAFSVHELPRDEPRTSYRSAVTSTGSSHLDSITTRSSVATADSSVSDCVKIDSSWADDAEQEDEDEGEFTIDDALDMYLGGFGTPPHSTFDFRRSMDSRRGSFPFPPMNTGNLTVGPSSSPRRNGPELGHAHRRSHSTSIVDRKSILLDVVDPNLTIKGPLNHTKSSTQILPGGNLPGAPSDLQNQVVLPGALSDLQNQVVLPGAPSDLPNQVVLPVAIPRDRYGFKKTSLHNTLEQYDAWEKNYNQHLERRRVKWDALMKQFGYPTENPTRFPMKSEKIKRYVRKGIPPDWRGAAWFWYAGGPGKLAKDPGLYWGLLLRVSQGELSDNDREHIERDLNRTFPDNVRFKPDPSTGPPPDEEAPMIKSLRRVLQAFAIHNPNIGYCQSLNFIAGLLLLFLDEDEEKAFVLLNVVTTEHLPGTHGVALEGANIDIAVLMTSIKESLPSIWAKLDDKPTTPGVIGAPTRLPTVSLATTAWFMSLFVGTLPIECVLRVWDCLFFEGSKTLFRVALAIFKSGESAIKAVSDPMEIFQVVQSMPRGMLDANTLMETCFRKRGGFGNLSQDLVEKRRQEGRDATRQGRVLTADGEGLGRRSLMSGKSKGRFTRRSKAG